jgi:putative addiction module killer protein
VFAIKPLPEFTAWLDGVADAMVRGVVVARIKRLERGLMGDVAPVGECVSELRIHAGAGWRVHFTRRGWIEGRKSNEQTHQSCRAAGVRRCALP